MGLLDNNTVRVEKKTGLEGTPFVPVASSRYFDLWFWDKKTTGRELRLTYRDIFAWSNSTKLFLVKGKITDTPVEIQVNDTNFPHLRRTLSNSWPKIIRVIACPCTFAYSYDGSVYGNISNLESNHVRVCVIFENGQIYHNYPSSNDDCDFWNSVYRTDENDTLVEDLFTKFDESVVWDMAGRKAPVKTQTGDDAALIATGAYYYNPALPDNCYEMHPAIGQSNGYGNTVGFGATNSMNNISKGADIGIRARFMRPNMDDVSCNPFNYMGGYVADNLFTMIATYQNNSGSHPCRICVFGTQDGGRSWYNMYEFAGRDRVKKGASTYNDASGKGVALAQSGSAANGIYSVRRRTIVAPYEDAKEPSTLFEYSEPVAVQGVSGSSSGIIVTTGSSHGFKEGECVVFDYQQGVSPDGRVFDWMVNAAADGTTGGNGVMFKATEVTSTTFKLTLYIWNTETNLPVRHIHALNRCKDGVSVSCGEEYPNGGWIIYDAIRGSDAFWGYNVAIQNERNNNWVRLNSTKDSFMRPLGVIVQQEGKDTFCYIGVDHEDTPMNDVDMPEGRAQSFKHNSTGVWKVPLEGIDSQADNGLLLYPAAQTCFGLQKVDTAIVYVGQYGDFAISYDNGESWSEAVFPKGNWGQNGCHFGGITYDRRFSIDNILVQLKK